MQVRLGFELLSSLTDAESTVPYIQRMQSIPVITSCQREGYLALDRFVHKVAPKGPGLTLGCPTWTEATGQI